MDELPAEGVHRPLPMLTSWRVQPRPLPEMVRWMEELRKSGTDSRTSQSRSAQSSR